MKKYLNNDFVKFLFILVTFIAIGLVINAFCADASTFAAFAVVAGTAGGKHIVGEPLTTDLTNQVSPELLRNEIDERIVHVRPMATPLDQISRMGGARLCGSMIVDYYSVDTKPTSATVLDITHNSQVNGKFKSSVLETDNDAIFEASETIMVPSMTAQMLDGTVGTLVLYVVSRTSEGVNVIAVNNQNSQGIYIVPDIPEGATLVRMGRAAAELDVQTAQFESLPVKNTNFCQIFKAQVEQSTYQKIANKEVGWTFSDQEEAAIIDMRMGMEKNFLFGCKGRVYDPVKRGDIFLTGGIWAQAGKEQHYDIGALSLDRLIGISREAFTGHGGSAKKLLIGGTKLIEQLNMLDHVKVIGATDTLTHWGLDFSEIITKFGRLYVMASEVFDQCGHANDGIVIDPEYITKYCHVPFRAELLDLRKSGVRNTDAIVITEASCLVLRYPAAHMRIIGDSAPLV